MIDFEADRRACAAATTPTRQHLRRRRRRPARSLRRRQELLRPQQLPSPEHPHPRRPSPATWPARTPPTVFDADTRLYIAKVELVRTGRYFRRLKNDIRGRNIVLDGIAANYRDDRDEYGWFDVLSAPWAWPRRDSGREVPRFGVSDQTCRKVAARLLTELRAPKAATGGRAHRQATRRALQRFDNWLVPAGEPGAQYDDEATQ